MTTLSIQEKPLGLSSARIVLMAAAYGFELQANVLRRFDRAAQTIVG